MAPRTTESRPDWETARRRDRVQVTVQEGYSIWADVYDQGNALIELEERRVEPLLAGLKAGRALDVGAGIGRYTLKLAKRGYQVTATDPNRATLDVARESAGRGSLDIGFVQAGLENGVPAVGHYFDLVVCALVLCHVPGFDRVAADFHRVLKPGGHLLITDFHPDTIAAGIETVVSRDGVTYQLPNEHRTTDAYLEGIRGAGLKLLEVQHLPTREATREVFTDEYWKALADTNFCLVILAQKPES